MRRVSQAALDRVVNEFKKNLDQFLKEAAEAGPMFREVKQKYEELAADGSVQNALKAHNLETKASLKLGPSEKMLKDVNLVLKYERFYSPDTAPKPAKKKKATFKGFGSTTAKKSR